MTVLTDTSIRKILEKNRDTWMKGAEVKQNKLLINPFDEQSLTPIGYDLRIGDRYLKMCTKLKEFRRLKGKSELSKISISHNEVVAIETEEYIGMPQNKKYSGILVSKVSIAEKGLSHVSTSLDPDYKGKLVVTLTNHSNRKVTLERNQPFCTVIFLKNEEPALKDCEKDPDKHITFLVEDWKLPPKQIRKKILVWVLRVALPLAPLIYLLYRYFFAGVTEAEVAIFVALSSFLYLILDTLLRMGRAKKPT